MNKYKRWSDSENQLLISNIKLNYTLTEIANKLERSKFAVLKQLEKLLLQKNVNCQEIYENIVLNLTKETFDNNTLEEKDNNKSLLIEDNKITNEISFILDDIIDEIEETNHLNEEQIKCYNLAKSNKNILITGSGGCGKSFILKSIIQMLKRKNYNIGVTSSTGSSATLINGTTLHSFLNIGLANKSATELYEKLKFQSNKTNYKKLKKLDVLIIDEISMIDDVLFSKIAGYLSLIKEIKKPFGKVQLILCGDFYQLPPVNNDYCFKSPVWNMLKIQIIELKQMMRQSNDQEFQEMLKDIKLNNITNNIYNKLLQLKNKKFENTKIKPTKLYSRNEDINKINKNEFNKLVNQTNAKVFTYEIKYDSNSSSVSKYISNSNIEKSIDLCVGAQIMLTYNVDIIGNLVNGTRGIIKKLYHNYIIIETIDGNEHQIEYVKYINDLDENITFSYMPIKLAYAISIHKSQGMTIDFIEIDLGNTIFTYGMAYVALSRAKSLDSIILSKLSRNAFKINQDVINFYKKIIN